VTEARPCAGESLFIETPTATLQLSNASISVDCVDLLFSQISALHFQAAKKIRVTLPKITKRLQFSYLRILLLINNQVHLLFVTLTKNPSESC
jgi:hypothetical protein